MRTYTVQNVKRTMKMSVELIIKYFVTIGLGKIVLKQVIHNFICITPSIIFIYGHFQSMAVVYENLIILFFMENIILETIILGIQPAVSKTLAASLILVVP